MSFRSLVLGARKIELEFKNTMLLFTQKPNASIVGGFKQWLKAGRVVQKGQGAIWI